MDTPRRAAFPILDNAAEFAETVHEKIVSKDDEYRASVETGQTTAWAIPYQDVDESGTPLTPDWFCNVKDRAYRRLDQDQKDKANPMPEKLEGLDKK